MLALRQRSVLYNCCMTPHNEAVDNEAQFSPLSNGIMLMRTRFTDHAFERHSHDCYSIGLTTHGIQSFRCKGERHDSRAGDLVLFNPDEDHDGNRGSSGGFGYTMWYVPESFVRSCIDGDAGLTRPPYFAAPHLHAPRMAAAFGPLSRQLLAAPSESLLAESALRSFLGAMLLRHGEQPQAVIAPVRGVGLAQLGRVKEYMRAHFRSDLTITELANVAGLSRAHLSRAFAAAFHTPPHAYLNALRVAHAQTMIRLGVPLATVAIECGYADQSHLNRRFKGGIGVSPAQWRRMVCGKRADVPGNTG